MDLPIVEVANNESRELERKLNPEQAAEQLKAIRNAFLKVLNQEAETGAYALAEVDVSLTVSASGSIGWVTASAEGSLSLHFEPT